MTANVYKTFKAPATSDIVYRTTAPQTLAAGASYPIRQNMRFLTILTATDTSAISISFDNSSFFALPFGFTLSEFEATEVYVKNTSGSANTIVMAVGLANLRDNRFASGVVSVPITIADGADVTEGAKADAIATDTASPWSVISLLKGIWKRVFNASATAGAVSSFTSTSSAVLQAANANRLGLSIFNEGAGTLYVVLGATIASSTNYSVQIVPGAYYELPYLYTGEIRAIFSAAGTARVQELT